MSRIAIERRQFLEQGTAEDFFRAVAGLKALPTPEQAQTLFAAHGMQIVGPPLNAG